MTQWQPIETAPKDQRIWTASKCGRVFVTEWNKDRNRFSGYATNGSPPLAWQPFVVPVHPDREGK